MFHVALFFVHKFRRTFDRDDAVGSVISPGYWRELVELGKAKMWR